MRVPGYDDADITEITRSVAVTTRCIPATLFSCQRRFCGFPNCYPVGDRTRTPTNRPSYTGRRTDRLDEWMRVCGVCHTQTQLPQLVYRRLQNVSVVGCLEHLRVVSDISVCKAASAM